MLATLSLLFAALPQDRGYFPTPILLSDAVAGEFRAHGDFDGDGIADLLWFRDAPNNPSAVSVWVYIYIYEPACNVS